MKGFQKTDQMKFSWKFDKHWISFAIPEYGDRAVTLTTFWLHANDDILSVAAPCMVYNRPRDWKGRYLIIIWPQKQKIDNIYAHVQKEKRPKKLVYQPGNGGHDAHREATEKSGAS